MGKKLNITLVIFFVIVVAFSSNYENSEDNKVSVEMYEAKEEEIELKKDDGVGENYTFEYDNSIFKVQYKTDNWKIIDSYKINNEIDMELICKALINVHKIHGKDGKSYRTVEDMVNEWKLHNYAYFILPDSSALKINAKDVDFNPQDQGKDLKDFFKERLNI